MDRRQFMKGLAAAAVAPAVAPAVTEYVVRGFDMYGEPVVERFVYKTALTEVSLGYSITRIAIDTALQSSTFSSFPGVKVAEEIHGHTAADHP